jgi:hypothetical protein
MSFEQLLLVTDAKIVSFLILFKIIGDFFMKTAKDRFHEVMDSLSLNDYKVYTGIEGITKNMMSKLRQGHTEEVSVKILMPFCEAYPQVNANYILTGRGNMFLNNEDKMESSTDIGAIGLTYDELARLYETTVSRYERLIEHMKMKFETLENAFVDAKETFNRESA